MIDVMPGGEKKVRGVATHDGRCITADAVVVGIGREGSEWLSGICHKYGIMVVAGLIFGFPDDDEADIVENYNFLKSLDADSAYCQILTPYPKTVMRQQLLDQGVEGRGHGGFRIQDSSFGTIVSRRGDFLRAAVPLFRPSTWPNCETLKGLGARHSGVVPSEGRSLRAGNTDCRWPR